ncbi:MAG TPA: chitobiase/beta-hexosaminidase C-terminal domain-containing protein [Terracidiphilus sp.]|jgi:hypothetical protein
MGLIAFDSFASSTLQRRFPTLAWVVCGMLLCVAGGMAQRARAQAARQTEPGFAWDVRGTWQVSGGSIGIRNGDAVAAGALLLPDVSASEHSITILLPDGQRVLYQCYTTEDCERGFRVPALYKTPGWFDADVISRVRAVLAADRNGGAGDASRLQLPQDEAVGVVGEGGAVEIAGLAAAMQNGRYTYDVRSLSQPGTERKGLTVDKASRSVAVVLPGPGLYEVAFTDSLNSPRIEVLVAAITAGQKETVGKPFERLRKLLADWEEDNQGWPMHDVQHAYLKSLMLGIKPRSQRMTPREIARPGRTAEPFFIPKVGVLKGPAGITLHCATKGAVIHYTIDSSQPFLSSPAYDAAILAKRTTLTIKAFATAPGKKDSTVILGTFRPGE